MNTEEELAGAVRAALRELYPAPAAGEFVAAPPPQRMRYAPMLVGALAAVVVLATAIAVSTLGSRHQPAVPAATPLRSAPTPGRVAVAGWTQICIPHGVRAPEYIGLRLDKAEVLARDKHVTLLIVGADGACLVDDLSFYHHPTLIAIDANLRVVEAKYQD